MLACIRERERIAECINSLEPPARERHRDSEAPAKVVERSTPVGAIDLNVYRFVPCLSFVR